MSGKKSLFAGALLGGLAAGATIYMLKTAHGQEAKEYVKEKFDELKDRVQIYVQNQGYTSAEMKQSITDFVTQAGSQFFPNKKETVSDTIDSNPDVNKAFLQRKNYLKM